MEEPTEQEPGGFFEIRNPISIKGHYATLLVNQ
jgi:hypothetical protein